MDVGGGAGAYPLWLANQGYEVHLMDHTHSIVDWDSASSPSSRMDTLRASIVVNYGWLAAIGEERHRCRGVGIVIAICLEAEGKRLDPGMPIEAQA